MDKFVHPLYIIVLTVDLLSYIDSNSLKNVCGVSKEFCLRYTSSLRKVMGECVFDLEKHHRRLANSLANFAFNEKMKDYYNGMRGEDTIFTDTKTKLCKVCPEKTHTLYVKYLSSYCCISSYSWYIDGKISGYCMM